MCTFPSKPQLVVFAACLTALFVAYDASAQSIQEIIANNERAVAQAEEWAPNCQDRFLRAEIYNTASTARSLLQSARIHQDDVPPSYLISPITPVLQSITREIQSCTKVMSENSARHARCHTPIRIGMTTSEVLASDWCEPSQVKTTITGAHRYEQWIYEGARKSNEHEGYLYFTDGFLTVIQTK